MPNVKTTEMHAIMANNLAKAREHLANLQQQQRDIDEQIEDVVRVILGSERLLGALTPALAGATKKSPEFRQDEVDTNVMTEFEKQMEDHAA